MKRPEDVEREIREYFKPVREKAKKVEETLEQSVPKLSGSISKEAVEEALESISELEQLFSEMLEEVMELAASVASKPEGKQALESLKTMLSIIKDAKELAQMMQELSLGSEEKLEAVKGLLEDYARKFDSLVDKLRHTVSEELMYAIDKIVAETVKEEMYFPEVEE